MMLLKSFFTALSVWLALLDGAAKAAGWPGLRNEGGLLALIAAGLSWQRGGRPHMWSLWAALPVALLIHIGLAGWRGQRLNPLQQLRPGSYPDRSIERLDIAGPHGPVPALYVRPQVGGAGAVLVVHGSGCDKTFYAWRLVDALIARGLAVLLIDLDGHGENPRPQAYPAILGAVSGPVAWLRERHRRVGALAMSLGGAVTARAVAEGVRLDALVIEESPPQIRLDERAYREVQWREGSRLASHRLLHFFRDSGIVPIIRAWQTSGIRATIGTWDLFDALDLLGSLRTIGAQAASERPQTLLLYGDRDAIVPLKQAVRVAQAAAPWAEFVLFDGASHLSLPSELRVITRASNWLAKHLR